MQETVRVDVKRHLSLRNAARCRGNVHQAEITQVTALRRFLALSLKHVDSHRALVVRSRVFTQSPHTVTPDDRAAH